jgi:hypothetical protein
MALPDKNGTSEGISTQILKKSFYEYGDALLNVINQSLDQGIFPELWKVATILPIPKVLNTEKGEEFRGINVLPLYEKILEKIVYIQFKMLIDANNVLCSNQSGFRPGHSCETSLQLLLKRWKEELDLNKCIVSVFLDFKRAFETIDRSILLDKLQKYGVGGNVLVWFKSYLTDRTQVTNYNNVTSHVLINNYGVPQGSVLGPLLFIIYINDLPNCLDNVFVNVFADDTLISLAGYDYEEICNVLNIQLDKLSNWLKHNKLQLNVSKTKCMLVTSSERSTKQFLKSKVADKIIIDGEKPDFVTEFKYLGIILDEHLKFRKHVEYISKKISRKLGLLCRVGSFLSPSIKCLVYKTIIGPHFDYCSSLLWDIRQTDIISLQKLQNRGMRIILNCNRYTHICNMLDALHWTTVQQRIALNTLVFIFKIVNGSLPIYLNSFVKYANDVHTYNTRNAQRLYLEGKNKECTKKSVFYSGFQVYNKLDLTTRENTSVNLFRRDAIKFVKINYTL